jgi:hypothetical protein
MTSSTNAAEPKPQWQITDEFIDSMKSTYNNLNFLYGGKSTPECLDVLKEQLLLRDSLYDMRLELRALSSQVDTSKIQAHLTMPAQARSNYITSSTAR